MVSGLIWSTLNLARSSKPSNSGYFQDVISWISLCLIIFHALDAPPSKCPETKSDTFCKADFMYYYVYPISDTFTLLASIIGLISNEFTGIASKTGLESTSGLLPFEEYYKN